MSQQVPPNIQRVAYTAVFLLGGVLLPEVPGLPDLLGVLLRVGLVLVVVVFQPLEELRKVMWLPTLLLIVSLALVEASMEQGTALAGAASVLAVFLLWRPLSKMYSPESTSGRLVGHLMLLSLGALLVSVAFGAVGGELFLRLLSMVVWGVGMLLLSAALGITLYDAQKFFPALLWHQRSEPRFADARLKDTWRTLHGFAADHALAVSDGALLWQARGAVAGRRVALTVEDERIPPRIRISVELPALPAGFCLDAEPGLQAPIGDLIYDSSLSAGGVAPEVARALLGEHARVLPVLKEACGAQVRERLLSVEWGWEAFGARGASAQLLEEVLVLAALLSERAALAASAPAERVQRQGTPELR